MEEKKKRNYSLLICLMVTFITIYSYYSFLFPNISNIINTIYVICRLFFVLVFFVELFKYILSKNKKKYSFVFPAFLIVFFLFINYLLVFLKTGSFSFFSRNYAMELSKDTNDYIGYYFSNFITWTGNIGIVVWLFNNLKSNKEIIKSLLYSLSIIIIPIILILIMYPQYIGQRVSNFESTVFGGGIWNIGVIGFCSLGWLIILQYRNMNKTEKKLSVFGLALLIFSGIIGLSRSFVISLFLSYLFFLLFSKKTSNRILKNIVICFVLLLFVGMIVLIDSNLLYSLFGRFNNDTSGTNNVRFLLWMNYLKYLPEYFWFGAKLGGPYNYYTSLTYHAMHYLPHSSIINYLIMGGIGCLCSYLDLLKKIFISPKIKDKYLKICLKCWCLAYCLLAFANQTGFSQPIFYMAIGICLAIIKINQTKEDDLDEKHRNSNQN